MRSFRETRKRVHFKVKVMLDSLQKSARLLRVLRSLSPSLNFRRLSRVYRENKAYFCLDRDRSSARRFCCKDSFLPHFSKRCSEKKKRICAHVCKLSNLKRHKRQFEEFYFSERCFEAHHIPIPLFVP